MDRGAERQRELDGPLPGEVSEEFLLRMTFRADDPRVVLATARDVMAQVLDEHGRWPTPAEWRDRLPPVFVERCAPEDGVGDAWSLDGWLHWFEPTEEGDDRDWSWWDAGADGPGRGWLDVQVAGHPFGSGSLTWLLLASGGTDVDSD